MDTNSINPKKLILSDVDGVLCDWEWAFNVWMTEHGFKKQPEGALKYDIGRRYGIDKEQGFKLIEKFNNSPVIGFLPPLRDAMHYVRKLHDEHGYIFHCITSLSANKNACELRQKNLNKLFGNHVIQRVVCLDTGANKDEILKEYAGSNCWWLEDKIVNAKAGLKVGLRPLLVEHGHNMDFDHDEIPRVRNWKEIYEIITGVQSA